MFLNKLDSINKLLFAPNDMLVLKLSNSKSNVEYDAVDFYLNNLCCVFRNAKITPKKKGAFVALWKKANTTDRIINENRKTSANLPYNYMDMSICFIAVESHDSAGVFVFTSDILLKKDVLSAVSGSGGKLGFRVYPDWDILDNSTAIKTQEWQQQYFINFSSTQEQCFNKFKSIINQKVI